MTSQIILAKKRVQRATHEVVKQRKAHEAVHNWTNQLLEDRAKKMEITNRRQGNVNLVTCLGVVADIALTGGVHSFFLASTKVVAHVHFNSSLKRHNRKANEVLESERISALDLLLALQSLDRACSSLRHILRDIDHLPSHANTGSIVSIAFSPGKTTVLAELAFEGIHHAFHSHHGDILDMGISDGLIEVFGEEITSGALEFVSDFLPVVGMVWSILHLLHAIEHAESRSEEAKMLRGLVVTRKKDFKAMTEYIDLLSDCSNLCHNDASAVVVVMVVVVAVLWWYQWYWVIGILLCFILLCGINGNDSATTV
jgi:hypothetical protein